VAYHRGSRSPEIKIENLCALFLIPKGALNLVVKNAISEI